MKYYQEKGEVRPTQNKNDDAHSGWVSDKSARTRKGLQTKSDGTNRYESYGSRLNHLPPGMNLEDQWIAAINPQRQVVAGTDDVTDNPSGNDFVKGFVSVPMKNTDELYTNEHIDSFYRDAEVDGQTGYLERGNVLDRN